MADAVKRSVIAILLIVASVLLGYTVDVALDKREKANYPTKYSEYVKNGNAMRKSPINNVALTCLYTFSLTMTYSKPAMPITMINTFSTSNGVQLTYDTIGAKKNELNSSMISDILVPIPCVDREVASESP